MKRIFSILCFFIPLFIFPANLPVGDDDEVLVNTDNYKDYTIFVYKKGKASCPYLIKIQRHKNGYKEFMVIENDDDLFKYVMVEKTDKEIFYYPFAWQDVKAINVKDLKDNCKRVLDKSVSYRDKKAISK